MSRGDLARSAVETRAFRAEVWRQRQNEDAKARANMARSPNRRPLGPAEVSALDDLQRAESEKQDAELAAAIEGARVALFETPRKCTVLAPRIGQRAPFPERTPVDPRIAAARKVAPAAVRALVVALEVGDVSIARSAVWALGLALSEAKR